jgi:hypothetical protein
MLGNVFLPGKSGILKTKKAETSIASNNQCSASDALAVAEATRFRTEGGSPSETAAGSAALRMIPWNRYAWAVVCISFSKS